MISTPQSREELLLRLIKIPSVTQSARENDAALFVREHLSHLAYFKEHPSHLVLIETPLEGDADRPLHTVVARMMAKKSTPKTVVLIAHYDVVDVACYGNEIPYAFDPEELAKRLDPEEFPPRARQDLLSGGYIFGRGSMDMKCGLALELELLRDYDHDRDLFDVNVIVAAVPDEENTGCGMRRAASFLAQLKRDEGLEYIAGINTEPSDPGLPDAPNPLVFLGTLGKVLPTFYCRGLEAHVGNYYRALSAALLSSQIVRLAEAAPAFADPSRGVCHPSWICLQHKTLAREYVVTIPARSVAYFNCFMTTKTPADVLVDMESLAREAVARTCEQLAASHEALSKQGYAPPSRDFGDLPVIRFEEIHQKAARAFEGGEEKFREHMSAFLKSLPKGDMRDLGIELLEEMIRIARIEAPFIAFGFLPPYCPQLSSLTGKPQANALVRAAERVIHEAKERFDTTLDTAEFFAGLSDLSYLGFMGSTESVEAMARNCPGWGELYSVPIGDLAEIDMPVANLGPCGYDAHLKSERLARAYSLDILPELLVSMIRALSEE